tara:strand:- start:24 stop:428 length:405 start_codon:yes stop_codon:yes gene_type:complete
MSALTDSIDSEIESKWRPLLTTTQESYLAENNIYAQTRWSHVNAPEDGAEVLPDNLADKPSDQDEGWNDLVDIASELMTARGRVGVYNGPDGQGFVLTVQVRETEALMQRSINFGPITDRDHAWAEVDENPPKP